MVCCDETPIRVGVRKAKKYLLVACNRLFTWYMLGDRTMATFTKFIIAEATGVIVHYRYQNYDSADLGVHAHQLCCSHLLRDLEDCAETHPDAMWPGQIQTALRGLIHAANLAREQGQDAIAPGTLAMWTKSFRHGVRTVWPRSAASPDQPKRSLNRSGGFCWKCCATARTTCCDSPMI